mmetsp:Transcript_24812/g.70869  ORF Transcript_24812/g.70869 Transcript_24812/m.70869 type:complete len:364 (+) Transcript_24812:59-1150(+)
MSLQAPFASPKPYGDKVPGTYIEADSLTALFLKHHHQHAPLVTPEYPQRDVVFSNPSENANESTTATTEGRQASLQFASEALKMVQGGLLSPRETKRVLAPRPVKTGSMQKGLPPSIPLIGRMSKPSSFHQSESGGGSRLNKFVRRLHDMLQAEKDSGVVEWRRGLLVLFSTDAFAKKLLPKYFNTKNFKTFRRQLNYYGFVHVRSFNTTGASTTALWVNRGLANEGTDEISSVLKLKRVEPCETAKTAEGRRQRKELAKHTVEEDIGVSAKTLQLEQIRSMALRGDDDVLISEPLAGRLLSDPRPQIPMEVHLIMDASSTESGSHSSTCFSGKEETWDASSFSQEDSASASAANVLLMLSRA